MPGGWNSQMEVDNTQCDYDRVERMQERVMISVGWNSQEGTSDTKHDPWLVKASLRGQR